MKILQEVWFKFCPRRTFNALLVFFQILVQKVTMLAFSLHDGKVKKSEELNEIQKREAIKLVITSELTFCGISPIF